MFLKPEAFEDVREFMSGFIKDMSTISRKFRQYVSVLAGKPKSGRSFRQADFLFFAKFVRPLWKLGVAGFLLTIAVTALGSLVPLTSKVFIDCVIMKEFGSVDKALAALRLESLAGPAKQMLGDVNIVVVVVLAVGAAMGLIGIVKNIVTIKFQQDVTFNIQTALFDHLLRFPLSLIKKKQVGYLMSRVSDDVTMFQYLLSAAIPQIFTHVLSFCFVFAILFTLNAKVFLFLICLFPFWAFVYYFFAARVRAVSRSEMEKRAQVSRHMQESISGAETVKSYGAEKREVEKVSKKIEKLFDTKLKSAILRSLSEQSMKAAKLVTTLVIVWFCVHEIKRGAMTVGDLTALIFYTLYLSGIAGGLSSNFIMLQTVAASMERLIEMFDIVPEFDDRQSGEMITPESRPREIRFENVHFSYEKNRPVLQNVSFEINAGESIALIGASGAGKTTLINLLLKFHHPGKGSIRINNIDIEKIDTRWLRKQVGFVSQDIFLFNDTIENNIKYGKPDASLKDVVDAAKNANIHSAIEELPDGYNTVVGEKGMTLSVGQRQRVSIARAYLKNAPILILDEPTSALDAGTEAELIESLKKLIRNRTALMISHRMSLAGIATKIFSLENGQTGAIKSVGSS